MYFNTIQEFGFFVESQLSIARKWNAQDLSEQIFTEANGISLQDAITMAKKGGLWQEGAQGLRAIQFKANSDFQQRVNALKADMVGFMPIVPHVLMGVPNTMLSIERTTKASNFIKVGVNVSKAGFIEDSDALNRGRAILEVIDALELQGYRVELWAYWRNGWNGCESANINVRIKATNEPLNLSALAFAVCSTFFQRRLCWHVAEKHQTWYKLTFKKNKYGSGARASNNGFDVAIPFMSEEPWHCPDRARSIVLGYFESQIKAA